MNMWWGPAVEVQDLRCGGTECCGPELRLEGGPGPKVALFNFIELD